MYECLLACVYVYHMHVWCPHKSEESVKSPETRVIDGYKLPYGYWEPNLGPLQESQVRFTWAEPSLQSLVLLTCVCVCACVVCSACTWLCRFLCLLVCMKRLGEDVRCLPASLSALQPWDWPLSEWELVVSVRLASLFLFFNAGVRGMLCCAGFLCGCWGFEFHSSCYIVFLPTEPSPQFLTLFV